jgi:hypothetical protein
MGMLDVKALTGSVYDLHDLRKFWNNYKIKLPNGANEWIDAKLSETNVVLTDSDKLRIQYYIAYGHCINTDIFKESIFKQVYENSKQIVYLYQFEQDIENELTKQ